MNRRIALSSALCATVLAAGAFVVGVGDSYQLGRVGVGPANITVSDASGNSAPKGSKVAGLLFCERNANRR